jgi:photosystem II stability/assembly factor-like uncharacterized protein
MSSSDETPQLSKVFFLKPSAIPRALVIDKGDHILVSEDNGDTWGRIPTNLVQGTIPITQRNK